MLREKHLTVFLLILIAQAILLLLFVFFRYIDADEGLYLMAAYQVWEGKIPYLDFVYVQMPLLPYLYSFVSHSGFSSFTEARMISVLLTVFLGFLLFSFARRISEDIKIPLFLFFLYAFNGLILTWNSVVKTYAFSNLFAFLSFMFFIQILLSLRIRGTDLFLSGIFIGLALSCRSVFFLIFLAQVVIIFFLLPSKITNLAHFLAGATSSSLLSIYLFLKNPESFIFNNFSYHQLWGGKTIWMGLSAKLFALAKFIFYPQNLFILVLAAISIFLLTKKRKTARRFSEQDRVYLIAFVFSVILLVSYFLVTPTQLQYYHQALPYLLILSLPGLTKFITFCRREKFVIYGSCAVYLLCIIPYLLIFIFTIREKDKVFGIGQVKKVVEVVEENSTEGQRILTDWPGYAVLAKRDVVKGTETCGYDVSHLLTKDQLRRFNIIDEKGKKDVIENKKVNLIVIGLGGNANVNSLIDENYYLVEKIRESKIFVKK